MIDESDEELMVESAQSSSIQKKPQKPLIPAATKNIK